MTKIQKLHLDLIRESSFNAFDGDKVADWLEGRKDLWKGALMVQGRTPGITLRDLPSYNNVDTLFLTVPDEASAGIILRAMRGLLQADEADVVPPDAQAEELGTRVGGLVLRIWWD